MGIGILLLRPSEGFADFVSAQRFYKSKHYAKAASAFHEALVDPQQVANATKAEWGLAQSLRKMGLHFSASKYLSQIVRRGTSGTNPYASLAVEDLSVINNRLTLGQSQIAQLFVANIDPALLSGEGQGFYAYHMGTKAFEAKKFMSAQYHLARVQNTSQYYSAALFHLGVIATFSGDLPASMSYFEQVRELAKKSKKSARLYEEATLNIARTYYHYLRYADALHSYAKIPRLSEKWPQAQLESSWASLILKKPNDALSYLRNLHPSAFKDHFIPESYMVQAIGFINICRFDKAKESLRLFEEQYGPVLQGISSLLANTRSNPKELFRIVFNHRSRSLKSYRSAWRMLVFLSQTDYYKQTVASLANTDLELARLDDAFPKGQPSRLMREIKSFLVKRKVVAVDDTGKYLHAVADSKLYRYLIVLFQQASDLTPHLELGARDPAFKPSADGTCYPFP